jgi:hypothetical protein
MNTGGTEEINGVLIMCLMLKVNDSGKVKFVIGIAARFKVRTAGNTTYKQTQKKTIILKYVYI